MKHSKEYIQLWAEGKVGQSYPQSITLARLWIEQRLLIEDIAKEECVYLDKAFPCRSDKCFPCRAREMVAE